MANKWVAEVAAQSAVVPSWLTLQEASTSFPVQLSAKANAAGTTKQAAIDVVLFVILKNQT
jgi:hypothetical protein